MRRFFLLLRLFAAMWSRRASGDGRVEASRCLATRAFSPAAIREHAQAFSREAFQARFKAELERVARLRR